MNLLTAEEAMAIINSYPSCVHWKLILDKKEMLITNESVLEEEE